MSNDYFKTILHYLLPKRLVTMLAGCLAEVRVPVIKNYLIQRFIDAYDVNMQEALQENVKDYPTFNDFFIRHLKKDCRPIAPADLICPVDGFVSEIGQIEQGQLLQAKGRYYHVDELLAADAAQCALFRRGSFVTLYLSPRDYHRIHMPIAAELTSMIHVPGALFSVQPATTRTIPKLFARNERLVVFFETAVGPMVMVLVGATIVGKIGTTWHGDLERRLKKQAYFYNPIAAIKTGLKQAEEMGYFKLWSTVILIFGEQTAVTWDPLLAAGSPVKLGQALGHCK